MIYKMKKSVYILLPIVLFLAGLYFGTPNDTNNAEAQQQNCFSIEGDFCVLKRRNFECPSGMFEEPSGLGSFDNLLDRVTGPGGHGYSFSICCT